MQGLAPSPPSQPAGPLVVLLIFIAGIVVWAQSPSKWQTFKRMVFALLATAVMVLVLGAVLSNLGYGNAEFFGYVSVPCSVIAAYIMGRQHVSALKKQRKDGAAGRATD